MTRTDAAPGPDARDARAAPHGSTAGPGRGAALSEQECTAIREAVTAAVLVTPPGLREDLEYDPGASLRLVEASRVAAEQTSRLLREAVTSARGAGHSWDVIGALLGVSRQGAQQRFGDAGAARPEPVAAGSGAPARRILTPLTAFTEMAVLEREGRCGWHVVDYGTLFHVVEASPWQWEHHRAPWSPVASRRLAAEGWSLVKTMTFPWGYYTRCTDAPAGPAA